MKKIIVLLSLCMLVLAGCEEKTKEIELTFLEKSIIDDGYPYVIYESKSEKKYYEVSISSYEFNNLDLKEGDTVKVSKNVSAKDIFGTRYSAKMKGKEIELKETKYFYGKVKGEK